MSLTAVGVDDGPSSEMGVPTSNIGSADEASSSSSSSCSEERHPLKNTLILSHLFRLVPLKELRGHALVCKTWASEVELAWRKRYNVTLNYAKRGIALSSPAPVCRLVPSPRTAAPLTTEKKGTSLKDFLNFWDEECEENSFRYYTLHQWQLTKRTVRIGARCLDGQIGRFWSSVGPTITNLTLVDCKISSPREFHEILFQRCPKLRVLAIENCTPSSPEKLDWKLDPNDELSIGGAFMSLTSLSIRFQNCNQLVGTEEWKWKLPCNYEELLSRFPKLTSLEISYHNGPEGAGGVEELRSWLLAIRNVRSQHPTSLQLNKFNINPRPILTTETMEYFNLLCELNLPVTSLSVELASNLHGDIRHELMTSLISKNEQHLIEISAGKRLLDLGYSNPDVTQLYDFPCHATLSNLTRLYLSDRVVRSMTFLRLTPNLKLLKLYGNGVNAITDYVALERSHIISATTQIEMENVVVARLTSLALHLKVTAEDLARLRKWLPSVSSLTTFVDNELILPIIKHWSGLHHLHIINTWLSDRGFTGYRFLGFPAQRASENGEIRSARIIPFVPSITALRDLTCLKMTEAFPGSSRLSDFSAFFGVACLPKLKQFSFGAKNEFSGVAKIALSSRFRCTLQPYQLSDLQLHCDDE